MTRFTKSVLLCVVLLAVLACGVKLPADTPTPTPPAEVDDALSSLRDLPTVTPAPPVIELKNGKVLP